jgi:hypothetical protein
VTEAFGNLALSQSPGTFLKAVDWDDLDGYLPATPESPEITLPRTVYTVGPPHGGKATPPDHLRERVATLSGSPATYVTRLGHE